MALFSKGLGCYSKEKVVPHLCPDIKSTFGLKWPVPYAVLPTLDAKRLEDTGVLKPKEAIVTPIHKTGDRLSPGSCKPVSLTSVPSKVMERLVKQAILEHLSSSNLISPVQHGILPHRSRVTNMLVFVDSSTQAKDEGPISDVIFFDFSKAFDKVAHVPLLHKLESYGIQGKILRWIKAFLSDRSFRVRIVSTYSSPAPDSIGVPQGSVLAPLMFLIYVNDLPDVCMVSSPKACDVRHEYPFSPFLSNFVDVQMMRPKLEGLQNPEIQIVAC
ncbi:hypothetical protein T265_05485 [Opisthorchis viverrini]|uniref:Reverse transcriptase domain-containing protein n=1 Tax=Opisthorchis viverrini TaxID=6198 RepID=A0A074ZVN6_OPIVI|nr:hypothetical protein T265_05485 [Opisthorchis viverrini]KER27445.1 hypothetical protein T265_05485 [Opisthorchis viverrini]